MELSVGMGEMMVAESPSLLRAVGIGSCIAVILYDESSAIGGLAHVVLPCMAESKDKSNPARFIDVAVDMMKGEMKKQNARIQHIKAKIFGGANMFPEIILSDSSMDIGRRNISAIRKELKKHKIDIIAEEVGDNYGRSILFDTEDGSVIVKAAHISDRKY